MAGYTTSIINMIVKNLRDEYQFQNGFPILKELIQNADDSRAKRFVFGDHIGFPEADHSLMQGSGLWFFNDGEFKPSDKRAIRSFGENTKAGENGSIGKFGLGMKSVFHLCEAFFYLAYDGVEQHCVLMNPWDRGEDGNIHSDWLEPDTDTQEKLKSIADAHVKGAKTWFLLWIPLRQKRHLQKSNKHVVGAILDRFPGDDHKQDLSFLAESDLQNRLAILLPLLPRLEQIEFSSSNSDWPSFRLTIETTGRLHTSDEKEVDATGKVLANPSNRSLFMFAGKKYQDGNSLFKEFKKQRAWPKTYCWDENGIEKPADDKSEPEGAVLIGHEENQAGRVDLQWAVFLPLEDHGFEYLIPDSSRRYRIVLHGQYSIDAGRRGIYEFQKLDKADDSTLDSLDESSLRRRWNQEVAQRITLPLLLPTLADYVRDHQLKDEEIKALTFSLFHATSKTGDQTKFGELYREYLCREYDWVKVITENGGEWQLLSNQRRILPLPAPPLSDPNRPWRLLPGLRVLQNVGFRDLGAPSFQKKTSQWQESDWQIVVSKGFDEAFTSSSGLDYLAGFLRMNGEDAWLKTESVQDVLLAELKSGFSDSFEMLKENRQKIQRIVDALLPERRLKLGPIETDAKRIIPNKLWQALWRCKTRILLLPSYLDGQINACAKSTPEDVLKWLTALQGEMNGKFAVSALQVSGELLKTLDEEQRTALIRRNPTLKIVSAREPRQQKMIAVSFTELETAKQRSNLFASVGDLNKPEGLTSLLAAVLPGESILLLNAENRKVIFPKEILPAANDQKAILASLVSGVSAKKLGDLASRLILMEYANKTELDHQAMLGLRYLLHGDVNHCKDSTSILWIRGNGQSSAWEKLWRQITGIQENAVWNVLESRLAEELRVSKSEWSQLKIQEIAPDQVINALPNKIGAIQGQAFSFLERVEILCRVDDRDLWQRLPLHTYENGEVAAIRTNTFLAGIVLPKALVSRVHIVAKSEDANLLKKQRHWITELDVKAGAMVALDTENPVEFWELLLEASKYKAEFDQDNVNSYIQKKWLPLLNGQTIAPQDVIDNEALAEDIRRLSSLAEYCYAESNDLAENVRNHAQFDSLKQFFAREPKDVLQNLGLLMEVASDYAIGQITPENPEKFKQAATALKKYPKLPGWAVIHNAIESFGPEACITHLLPQAKRTIDTKQVINVLQWLEDKNTPNTMQAHCLYLSQLVTENSNIDQILPKLRLRSQSGNWKMATDLCHEAAGVDRDFLLDNQHARCLTGMIKNANTLTNAISRSGVEVADITLNIRAAPKIIEEYFAPWQGQTRGELIGALLSLLGKSVRDIAKNYLLPHSHCWLADQIGWQDPGLTKDGTKEWMGGLSVEDALDTFTLVAKKVLDDRVSVPNLIGEQICVPLKNDPDTLIAGSIGGDSRHLSIPLREISPENYSPERLSTLLRTTAEQILKSAYNQPKCNLQILWAELNQSEQLEIDVVRYMILDQLDLYLRQLGVNRSPIFKPAIDELKNAKNRLAEVKHKDGNLKEIEQEFSQKREQLANLLISDTNAQDCVLTNMRIKLEDYQYQPDSILFELFQNADDAAIELGRCENYFDEEVIDIPSAARRFVVHFEENIIRTFHWGRLINFRGRQDIENRWPGYGEDLEKMLILSASDKPSDAAVTGRFGLGFKSVFLVSNNPRILSGDLRVQIVGGILPEPWVDAGITARALESQTHERRYRGTAIELPLLEDLNCSAIVHRFQSLGGLLCIFAHAIRQIEIGDEQFEWSPQEVMSGIEIGSVITVGGKAKRWLVFRLENHATIAIALNSRGFQELRKDIPSLWVTAPTRLEDSFGFAVSAPFNIDAGRGQLAGNNQDVAQQVGKVLGWKLAELSRECERDWTNWRQYLVLSDDVTLGEFWASLWKTLSEGWLAHSTIEGGYGLGRTIAVTALGILLEETNHIPTGLPIPFSNWVNRSSIRYKASEAWAKPKILKALENWQLFAQRMDGGFIISDNICDVLRQIDQESYISSLNVDGLLTLLDDLRCDSTSAKALETILSTLPEQDVHAESLSKLRFQSRTKEWKASWYLLQADTEDTEEALRAAFAPGGYLLSNDYKATAKLFFMRCRPRFDADTERLKEWAFKADQAITQNAVLRYILKGELGGKLAESMRNNLAGTWLADFSPNHVALNDWSSQERVDLLRLLMPDAIQQQMQRAFFTNIFRPEPISRYEPQALDQIAEWWEREGRQSYLQDYIDQLYPRGELPNIQFDEDGGIDRTGWMTLFSVGVFQRLGRIQDFQTRGFIEMLEQNGWWQIFCESDPRENGEEWLQVLRQFSEDQVDDEVYSHWFDCFPRLFKIASRLEDYAALFQGIELRSLVVQNQLLTPDYDSVLQGSGIDLSPINRTLRKGFNLVIRELLRQEVLTTPAAIPHAYMPTKKLLRLLERLNVDLTDETGPSIHSALCEILGDEQAIFGGDYDIPLQILARSENSDLIREICQINFEDSDEDEDYYV